MKIELKLNGKNFKETKLFNVLYTLLGLVVWLSTNFFLGLTITKGFELKYTDFLYWVLIFYSVYISYLVLNNWFKK